MKQQILFALVLSLSFNCVLAQDKTPYFDPTLRTQASTPNRLIIGPPTDQRLTAIINGEDNHKIAIIENSQYHVGDHIGEWKIIRIDATTVYLQHEDQTATIRFKPEQYVKLSTEAAS